MVRVMIRLVADAVLVAMLLFLSAGTVLWWRAWVLVAVLLLVRAVGVGAVYHTNPGLLLERAGLPIRKGQPLIDRMLVLAVLATGFLGLPIVAGLDAFRWHALPRPVGSVAALGLALFAIGWSVKGLALRANAYAVTAVRLQSERAHAVADSGPYAVVRHPFYAADPLILVGLGLWLESYVAALAAAIPIALMVIRLLLEERFLRRNLPGYTAYVERVRFRLIPGMVGLPARRSSRSVSLTTVEAVGQLRQLAALAFYELARRLTDDRGGSLLHGNGISGPVGKGDRGDAAGARRIGDAGGV